MRKKQEIEDEDVKHLIAQNQEIIDALKNLNLKLNSATDFDLPLWAVYKNTSADSVDNENSSNTQEIQNSVNKSDTTDYQVI